MLYNVRYNKERKLPQYNMIHVTASLIQYNSTKTLYK